VHREPGREQCLHLAPRLLIVACARHVHFRHLGSRVQRDALRALQEVDSRVNLACFAAT
jgi:hypothetical protein